MGTFLPTPGTGKLILDDVESGARLDLAKPVRPRFQLFTEDPGMTPLLDACHLDFEVRATQAAR